MFTSHLTQNITEVSSSLNEMRETIRLIATNAEQTNLLALNDTVRIIGSIAGIIKRVNVYSRKIAESVENQSETTGQIVGQITDTVSVAESISKAISESVIASTEITKSIAKVDSVLTETAVGAAQSQQSGVELTDLADRLQKLVGQFRLDMEETERPNRSPQKIGT
jgi:methyl-accepting chemotaxis protein